MPESTRPYFVLEQTDVDADKPVFVLQMTVNARNAEHALRLAMERLDESEEKGSRLLVCVSQSMWRPVSVNVSMQRVVTVGG